MKEWYVAKTKPRKERLVEDYLFRTQGLDVFIPYIRRPEDKKAKLEILFPTYIFCLLDPRSKDWGAIRHTPGLSYFLGSGTELVPVSDKIITQLKHRVSVWNGGDFIPSYKPGDSIVITRGPFAGLDAIFQRYIPARQRCQILIEILGQQNKAELPLEDIRGTSKDLRLTYAN
ncbi:transcription termination/antitermination protein NusG [Chloroflexota bacterium]